MNQGRWNEAERLLVHVMDMRKKLLGAEHPDTITSVGNLANTHTTISANNNRRDQVRPRYVFFLISYCTSV